MLPWINEINPHWREVRGVAGYELQAMDQVIGIMLVIVVIGLLADKILFSPVERFLHRRWGTNP